MVGLRLRRDLADDRLSGVDSLDRAAGVADLLRSMVLAFASFETGAAAGVD